MSQIINFKFTLAPPSFRFRIFFEVFVPMVTIYLSSNLSTTNLRIRLVLPTPASPITTIFFIMSLTSVIFIPPNCVFRILFVFEFFTLQSVFNIFSQGFSNSFYLGDIRNWGFLKRIITIIPCFI